MLHAFWHNFTHNLFKPLLLFFYFGFLIPIMMVALYLVARLRNRGMDPAGNMRDESGYCALVTAGEREIDSGKEEYAERQLPHAVSVEPRPAKTELLNEVLLNPGICLLVGAIFIGFISGLQGQKAIQDDNSFFVSAFQGALCLFLLEMGMAASRKLKDLRSAGLGFILFGLIAPNVFATLGIIIAHGYAFYTHTEFKRGTYALFAVLCAAASYITVPAVQRLAVPEASPTLPLAAALGLTFSYNATIGIPLYIEIARVATWWGL
jgi:uncharacterized protein